MHLRETFGRIAARGHEVTLLCSGWRGAPRRTELDGMRIHRVGQRTTFGLLAPSYARRHLAARLFDVCVEDLNKVPLFTPLWISVPKLLLVHHLFGGVAFSAVSPLIALPTWLMERPLPRAYRRVAVQAVSVSTAAELRSRGFAADAISVVHNGVDVPESPMSPVTRAPVTRAPVPTVLFLGRLERYKRVDLVLRAFARVRERLPAQLVVAGAGSQARTLRRLADRLGLGEHATFVGHVDDHTKRILMTQAWVHVLTSRKEGWGITVMEAAACRTPTIASDVAGLQEAILHDLTGILVPHADTIALADALQRALSDPALVEQLGDAAYRRALRFDWDATADAMLEELHAVASGAPRVRAGEWARYTLPGARRAQALPLKDAGVVAHGSVRVEFAGGSELDGRSVAVTFGSPDVFGRTVFARVECWMGTAPGEAASPKGRPWFVELAGWPVEPREEARRLAARVLAHLAERRALEDGSDDGPRWLSPRAHCGEAKPYDRFVQADQRRRTVPCPTPRAPEDPG